MLEEFTKSLEKIESNYGQGETDATIPGLCDIAINVLLSAGYGLSQPWKKRGTEKPPPGHTLTYIDTIIILFRNFIPATLIPEWILTLPIMPASLQQIGRATGEFAQHTKELVAKER